MLHTVDADIANRIALEGRQEDASQSVADCDTITGFQWAELEFAERVIGLQH